MTKRLSKMNEAQEHRDIEKKKVSSFANLANSQLVINIFKKA